MVTMVDSDEIGCAGAPFHSTGWSGQLEMYEVAYSMCFKMFRLFLNQPIFKTIFGIQSPEETW